MTDTLTWRLPALPTFDPFLVCCTRVDVADFSLQLESTENSRYTNSFHLRRANTHTPTPAYIHTCCKFIHIIIIVLYVISYTSYCLARHFAHVMLCCTSHHWSVITRVVFSMLPIRQSAPWSLTCDHYVASDWIAGMHQYRKLVCQRGYGIHSTRV